jgi:hypothetical protein
MADRTHEGTKVTFATAVANIAAPTVAEIAAGTDLSNRITADGLGTEPVQNKASQPMLGDAFVAERVGTHGVAMTVTFKRDPAGPDAAWDLFNYRTTGFLIIGRNGSLAAAQKCEVYPVEAQKPVPLASAENEYQKFQVAFAVTSEPNIKATVA